MALARGNLDAGPHTWNELDLKDGKKRIVDCMNPGRDFYLPETTEAIARQYFTVENKSFYIETKSADSKRR